MKTGLIIRELSSALSTKEEDIIKTIERFKKEIEKNKSRISNLEYLMGDFEQKGH